MFVFSNIYLAIECDRTWNGTPPGSIGASEEYWRSIQPALGLAFGAFGEWSKEVGTLIGQLAEVASAVPERLTIRTAFEKNSHTN